MPRSFRQFGLRALLILFVVLAVGLGLWRWHMTHAEYVLDIVLQIKDQGGSVQWKSTGLSGLGNYSFREPDEVRWESGKVDDEAVQVLGKLPELEEVRLSGNPITDAGLAMLSHLPRIRKLNLAGTKVTDRGLEYIGQLSDLEELDIRNTSITEEGLVHLRGLPKLTQLAHDLKLTDIGIDHLTTLPGLRFERLTGENVTAASMQAVKQFPIEWMHLESPQEDDWAGPLADHPTLENLQVSGGVMQSADLRGILGSQTLKSLKLDGVVAGDDGLIDADKVVSINQIELIDTDISPAALLQRYGGSARFVEIHEQSEDGHAEVTLRTIRRGLRQVTWRGEPQEVDLNALKYCREATSLDLYWNEPIDRFAAVVNDMQEVSSFLVTLPIDDDVLRSLAQKPRLHKLLLYGPQKITPEGLAQFATGRKLGAVALKSANITDAHLEALGKAAHIQRLIIANNPITDEGLRHLTSWEGIVFLDISGCSGLTDEALRHVAKMKSLVALHAEGIDVSDQGLSHLHGMPALAVVGLEGESVTPAGIRALLNASPRANGVIVGKH